MVNVLGTESILQKELNNGADLEIQENFPQEIFLSFNNQKISNKYRGWQV